MKIIYVHCGPEFFSGLISTTISVVFMAARIAYIRFFTASYLPGKKQSGTFAILHSFSDGVFYIEFYDEFYVIHTRQNACLKTSATMILFPLSSKPPASTNSSNVRPFYTKRSEWDQKLTLNNHERAFECIYLLKKVARLHVRASTVKLLGRRYAATLVDRATGHFP